MTRFCILIVLLIATVSVTQRPFATAENTGPDLDLEGLMSCVTLSMTMDQLLQNIHVLRGARDTTMDALEKADLDYLNRDLTDRFNAYVPEYTHQCSRASYYQEDLASICENPVYGAATFCAVMEW